MYYLRRYPSLTSLILGKLCLSVDNNQLNDRALEHLSRINSLTKLNISGNLLHQTSLDKLIRLPLLVDFSMPDRSNETLNKVL